MYHKTREDVICYTLLVVVKNWKKTNKKPNEQQSSGHTKIFQTECAQLPPILKKDLHVCSNDAEGQIWYQASQR